MSLLRKKRIQDSQGFTIVELILACVIFPMVVIGVATAFTSLQRAYSTARQLNEIYAVLSACPELDRALEFNSLSTGTNCHPNDKFQVENTSGDATVTYNPEMTVTNTGDLPSGNPLKSVPDSKLVDLSVGFLKPNDSAPPLTMRILITRNGIGQQ
jgi:type II secretory pathway pseudopilin PulG